MLEQADEPMTDESCQTLYRKTITDYKVSFDDFKILSIVGKGTFGKVYLVQNIVTG